MKKAEPKCRFCRQGTLEVSHRKGLKDRVMGMVKMRPARCKNCQKRSYVRNVHLRRRSFPVYAQSIRSNLRGIGRRR